MNKNYSLSVNDVFFNTEGHRKFQGMSLELSGLLYELNDLYVKILSRRNDLNSFYGNFNMYANSLVFSCKKSNMTIL